MKENKKRTISLIKEKLGEHYYNIGFLNEKDIDISKTNETVDNVRWMDYNGYKNGWFADPFIYNVNDSEIAVFAEEFEYSSKKGKIVCVKIDRSSLKLKEVKTILEKDTHLSFPYIWKENNRLYILPENSANQSLTLYELNPSDLTIIGQWQLIDKPLLDAQICKIEDVYYIFAVNNETKYNKVSLIECSQFVYSSHNLKGPYIQHQTLYSDRRIERGAGSFFFHNGNLIRPAQNCENQYGGSLVFLQITKDAKDFFQEQEIGSLYPNPKYKESRKLHTFNKYDNLVVIDGNDFKSLLVSWITRTIKYKRV